MSLELDPKEVLEHLHALGYCNISPELLKEFIRDLKKLIRHDQKRGLLNRQRRDERMTCCQQKEIIPEDGDRNLGCPQLIEEDGRQTYRRGSPTSRSQQPQYPQQHYAESADDGSELSGGQSRPNSRVQEATRKENIPPRPPSSFIRPGNVGMRNKPKSDPVALYHYYQSVWSQNPQPGEDPRAQLRWNIRHQMMGKQKQSTILPRAESEEKLKNRPEWQS